jgi:hypothetical protein
MIGDFNDGARTVTIAHHVSETVVQRHSTIDAFADRNPHALRLALLTRDLGDLSDAYLTGADHIYERLAVLAGAAEEWMLEFQREAAR